MFSKDCSNELLTLITAYFGQDYDLIDDSEDIRKKIGIYIRCSDRLSKNQLLENIDDFLGLEDSFDETFHDYYGFHFVPELWGTTARDFLLLVREKVSRALQEEENN
ncbi:contact-dependent growth inhibition system immunity protein [Brenneria tiliae]|uniref:contact-dependent growth inhibition system immunity protein n=1 Tax=Brenneria tiliae TaxID=2914984 RepID=UPI002014A15F|nr:contact-dependent growth inhibition system immunity protein [Brenneria tiliae]MCL2899172.1 contact-dependent growth inhibition system immunity protein [Brenneria tiliae]MCL2903550.1 contact-dependent growth inhibition system immunity protein [Brenneria tiliae]